VLLSTIGYQYINYRYTMYIVRHLSHPRKCWRWINLSLCSTII